MSSAGPGSVAAGSSAVGATSRGLRGDVGSPDGRRSLALTVETEIRARRDGVRLDLVEPLELGSTIRNRGDLRFLHNGWQSWSGTSALAGDAREPRPPLAFLRDFAVSPSAPHLGGAGHLSSDLFAVAASDLDGAAVVLGYLGGASQFGGFELDARGAAATRLLPRLPFEGVLLRRGVVRYGEPLLVQWGEDVPGMLGAWADRLGSAMRARVPARRTVGWCSWYEYFTAIDEPTLRRNLPAAALLQDRLALDLFQIDDGYQAAIGDWLDTNAKFPHGLKALARDIGESGLTPGLWLAPFIARPESTLAREHPGWLLRDAEGRPRRGVYNPAWGRTDAAFALDLTHEGALAWLAETSRALVSDLGFRFLKLDFLYAAALAGERRDPTRTSAEALRLGLEAIRSAVGDEVHLLGCGCPLGPAIGVVDSMRIGADVAPYWRDILSRGPGRDYDFPSTRNAVRNTIVRAFLHRRLWRNDPDCLLVRDRRTKLTRDEVVTLASTIALSGGTLLLSDELPGLAADRLAIAERVVAIQNDLLDEPPTCLDPLRPGFSRILAARARDGRAYLLVVNPDDAEAYVTLAGAAMEGLGRMLGGSPVSAVDHWTGESLGIHGGRLELGRLAPHACRLLVLSRHAAPAPVIS